MSADNLNALLANRAWVKRRVDRVEFLDLTTVRRTIGFTLDRWLLARAQPSSHSNLIPLGWFVPWANAGAVLLDANKHVIPYLTSAESDRLILAQINSRLEAVGVTDACKLELLERVRDHRKDPGIPGHRCQSCAATHCAPGYAELTSDKWGCRATRELLVELYGRHLTEDTRARELAQILLAWQTNFVLLARLDSPPPASGWATLQLSFDQELREWEPPWEQRKRILKKVDLTDTEAGEWRRHISRGGPFHEDLDKLFPAALRGLLAGRKHALPRRVGRRGLLNLAWHVAWHQAGGVDSPSHQLDVVLPNELMAVRMRMLRARDGKRRATVADQVGSRATIVAPELDDEDREDDNHAQPPQQLPPSPALFSLVITQRSTAAWNGGVWIALLTGVAILATALFWLPKMDGTSTDAITILIIAPTLVATLLSVRAGSEIAEQLTTALRRLIGAVGVLAAICAISLIAQQGLDPGKRQMLAAGSLTALKWVWVGAAVALLSIAAALAFGAYRIRQLIAFGRRPSSRKLLNTCPGEVLNPTELPPIPPPDRWLAADEGELVPWGWLNDQPGQRSGPQPPYSDQCFWDDDGRRAVLVEWVQSIYRFKKSTCDRRTPQA